MRRPRVVRLRRLLAARNNALDLYAERVAALEAENAALMEALNAALGRRIGELARTGSPAPETGKGAGA